MTIFWGAFNWVLSKLSSKALLWIVISLITINLSQCTIYKYKLYKSADLVKEQALLEYNNAALQASTEALEAAILVEKAKVVEQAAIAERREKRRAEWQAEGLKWKNKYIERCGNDEQCQNWSTSDYRGDG